MKTSELYNEILESGNEETKLEEVDITESSGATEIERCFYEWNKYFEGTEPGKVPLGEEVLTPEDEKYQEAVELANSVEYDEESLREFLDGDWHRKFEEVNDDTRIYPRYKVDGVFVSAFVNQLDSQDVSLPELEDTGFLGYNNEKDLVIEGSVGSGLGKKMKQESSIRVEGDAIKVGSYSEGGKIFVEGEIDEIGNQCGAEVYTLENGEWEHVNN